MSAKLKATPPWRRSVRCPLPPLPDVGPRRLAVTRLNVNNARCAALFASGLRRSDAPTADELTNWISDAVRRFGVAGCVSRMAREFGDHPEAAARRYVCPVWHERAGRLSSSTVVLIKVHDFR